MHFLSRLGQVFSHFKPISLLDILLVAAVVYMGLRLIRGTRALQLAAGLGLYVAVYALSGVVGLHTLNWLLGRLLLPGVLILVILFQPELRLALERLGRRWIRVPTPFGGRATLPKVVSAIVRACSELSKRRHGALIALERTTGLDDIALTGVPLEARLSAPLLLSIFNPQSPLHDGAVLVRGDRVVAAGCLLPLPERSYQTEIAHTRHRAGLGLSEVTDAVAIVVSEETGSISLCHEGRMWRGLSEEELRERLLMLLGRE